MFESPVAPTDSRVKRAATTVFRVVRSFQRSLAQLPVRAGAIVQDIAQAWQESARPNA